MSDDKLDIILNRLDEIERRLGINTPIEAASEHKPKKNHQSLKLVIIFFIVFIALFNIFLVLIEMVKPENNLQTNQISALIASLFFSLVLAYSINERRKDKQESD